MSDKTGDLPKPYTIWNHPYMSWLDLIITFLVGWFGGLNSLSKLTPTSDEAKAVVKKKRAVMNDFDRKTLQLIQYRKWKKAANVDLVQMTLLVPRNRTILQDQFGVKITKESVEKSLPPSNIDNDEIPVLLTFPLSIIPESTRQKSKAIASRTLNKCGCIDIVDREEQQIVLASLAEDESVPLILYFHGGGMVLGSRDEQLFVNVIESCVERCISSDNGRTEPDQTSKVVDRTRFIFASSEYSLAPEYPFPAGPVDALSVTTHLMRVLSTSSATTTTKQQKSSSARPFHVAGISAGGYIAVLVALECHRSPQLVPIQSCTPIAPMLSPAADSLSYYLNCNTSFMLTITLMRWFWRAYLNLDDVDDGDNDKPPPSSKTELLRRGSNYAVWEKSPWKRESDRSVRRLAEPLSDLPPTWKKEGGTNTTRFVIVTNMADPLYDDGVQLAKSLESAGAVVTHIPARCTHAMFDLDRKARNVLLDAIDNEWFRSQEAST